MALNSRFLVWLFVIVASLFCCGCQKAGDPIKIGFVGALTGRSSGLGQEGRAAFLLAVEQFNRQGGIDGRMVEAQVVDHRSSAEGVRQAMQEMAGSRVVAIVGPMMSQYAIPMASEANRLKIPVVSPTVSSEELSNRRDFFFRPHYSDAQAARKLAQQIEKDGARSVAIIQDLDNRAYVESWSQHFKQVFAGRVETIAFSSAARPSFSELIKPLSKRPPDAVLILANAPDTGLICQQNLKQGLEALTYATCWSASGPLISYGGASVEGLKFLHSVQVNSSEPAYLRFGRDFLERFNRKHLFPAVHAYDATRILLRALSEAAPRESLTDALLRLRTFRGLQYPLTFSDSGDLIEPPLFLTLVKDAELCFFCYVE